MAGDGSLSEWIQIGKLPDGRASPAATVFLDQLYVVGGMGTMTDDEVDTVLVATLNGDDTVGDFAEAPPLPQARAHSHQAPFLNGYIYSTGGSISHEDQAEVYVGAFE